MPVIGLVSDTHMPDRLREIPAAVFDILDGVDLILHAGDVGELHVLDTLSQIAPVIAVHGNDDTLESTRALPYHQLITIENKRLLLTHAHHPDREEEMRSRSAPNWHSHLQRRADMAHLHGADIIICGHTHIPMTLDYQGVWIINPGALASGNHFLKQTCQSVARLTLDTTVQLEFFDLAQPTMPFAPVVYPDDSFEVAMADYGASILDDTAEVILRDLRQSGIFEAYREAIVESIRPVSFRCWDGYQPTISAQELVAILRESHRLSEVWAQLEAMPSIKALL